MKETKLLIKLFKGRSEFIEGLNEFNRRISNELLRLARKKIITGKHYKVAKLRFIKRKTLEETGMKLGLTKERIRQIESRTLLELGMDKSDLNYYYIQ